MGKRLTAGLLMDRHRVSVCIKRNGSGCRDSEHDDVGSCFNIYPATSRVGKNHHVG